eukprot:2251968-Amphidinium_carterae.3
MQDHLGQGDARRPADHLDCLTVRFHREYFRCYYNAMQWNLLRGGCGANHPGCLSWRSLGELHAATHPRVAQRSDRQGSSDRSQAKSIATGSAEEGT